MNPAGAKQTTFPAERSLIVDKSLAETTLLLETASGSNNPEGRSKKPKAIRAG
jgi:hypothetical protein